MQASCTSLQQGKGFADSNTGSEMQGSHEKQAFCNCPAQPNGKPMGIAVVAINSPEEAEVVLQATILNVSICLNMSQYVSMSHHQQTEIASSVVGFMGGLTFLPACFGGRSTRGAMSCQTLHGKNMRNRYIEVFHHAEARSCAQLKQFMHSCKTALELTDDLMLAGRWWRGQGIRSNPRPWHMHAVLTSSNSN